MKEGNEFIEVQRFRQWWIWLIVAGNLALTVGLFGYGMYRQLILGQPWGSKPMSDGSLLVVGPVAILFSLGLFWLLLSARLEVKVASEALSVRFRPFVARRIPYREIARVEAKSYRPLVEYGGWGIRWGPGRGIAYNVSGTEGVLLELTNGKRILLGSQNPQPLAEAIRQRTDDPGGRAR